MALRKGFQVELRQGPNHLLLALAYLVCTSITSPIILASAILSVVVKPLQDLLCNKLRCLAIWAGYLYLYVLSVL